MVSATSRPFCPWRRNPVPIVQEAGWAPGRVWKGAEYFAPSGIRSPDRPARSKSLYRLRYPNIFHLEIQLIFQVLSHANQVTFCLFLKDSSLFYPLTFVIRYLKNFSSKHLCISLVFNEHYIPRLSTNYYAIKNTFCSISAWSFFQFM
jgi:hypothetical protein